MSIDSDFKAPARGAESRRQPRTRTTQGRTEPLQLPLDVLTAGRLIALLEDYHPEAPIVIEGQYGGFEWVRGTSRLPLRLNVNNLEGFGPHDRAEPTETAEATAVAILARPRSVVFEE